MPDDFWDKETSAPRKHMSRREREAERELTRAEVYAPELVGGWLGAQFRDAGYMRYVILRRVGLGTIALAVAILAFISLVMSGVLR